MEHEEFQNLDDKNKSVLEFKEWFTREWTLIKNQRLCGAQKEP